MESKEPKPSGDLRLRSKLDPDLSVSPVTPRFRVGGGPLDSGRGIEEEEGVESVVIDEDFGIDRWDEGGGEEEVEGGREGEGGGEGEGRSMS